MSEEYEEVPPYEEWLVKELREELSVRGLNNSGAKADLVSRLYMDDEVHAGDGDSADTYAEPEKADSGQGGGRVDGNAFCMYFTEDLSGDFNKLPETNDHSRMLQETYHVAVTTSGRKVIGGPFDGYLAEKAIIGNKVSYKYCVMLRPE